MRAQIHDLVRDRATLQPGEPALTFKDNTLTYAALWRRVLEVANGLRRLGLNAGDRVGVYLEKRLETVEACFGASAAGGVFVPINPLLRPKQVAYILDNCAVRILVTSADRYAQMRAELEQAASVTCVLVVGLSDDEAAPTGAPVQDWARATAASDVEASSEAPRRIDHDMAAIFYTSGSTGMPKGVVLSHRNLIVGAESVSHYLANGSDDVILSVLPLSFDAGFSQLTTGFNVGAHVVLMNYLFPEDVISMCSRHGVTGITCVPPLWMQLVEKPWPPEATATLRYFANTGGRMPKATLDRLRSIFPAARPFLMYGLTEAFRSTYLDPSEVDRRPDSIGKAIPNAEILVVRQDGTLCAPDEPGELVHRGALVSLGYWGDAERTAERFRPAPGQADGLCMPEIAVWSGDIVRRDTEGFLYFVGRKDEMIKTSGYRVSPAEVEEVAYDSGLVRDAVALGIDNPRLGQHIALVVSPAEGKELTAASLLAAMKKQLPLYMVPQEIVIRSSLPRSPNGKFDRNLIREELGACR